jgi:AraC-like DNA-binding protein
MAQNGQSAPPSSAPEVVLRAFTCRYSDGHVLPLHHHPWGQLLFAREGVMEVAAGGREGALSWVVPPSRALWIGAHVPHRVQMVGAVEMRTLYLHESIARALPPELLGSCVLHVSPLLRELILHVSDVAPLVRDPSRPREARLVDLLVDLFEVVQQPPTNLAWPVDPRARRVAEALAADPSQEHALVDLARLAGASERTLARLFLQETGLTVGRFRRELRLRHALRLLANGSPVTNVALEVGYDSTSAFVTTFRRAFGVTPGDFFRS